MNMSKEGQVCHESPLSYAFVLCFGLLLMHGLFFLLSDHLPNKNTIHLPDWPGSSRDPRWTRGFRILRSNDRTTMLHASGLIIWDSHFQPRSASDQRCKLIIETSGIDMNILTRQEQTMTSLADYLFILLRLFHQSIRDLVIAPLNQGSSCLTTHNRSDRWTGENTIVTRNLMILSTGPKPEPDSCYQTVHRPRPRSNLND